MVQLTLYKYQVTVFKISYIFFYENQICKVTLHISLDKVVMAVETTRNKSMQKLN